MARFSCTISWCSGGLASEIVEGLQKPLYTTTVMRSTWPLAVQAMTGQMMTLALEVTSSKERVGLDEQQLKASGELAPKVSLAPSPVAPAVVVSAEAAMWR